MDPMGVKRGPHGRSPEPMQFAIEVQAWFSWIQSIGSQEDDELRQGKKALIAVG